MFELISVTISVTIGISFYPVLPTKMDGVELAATSSGDNSKQWPSKPQ